MVQQWALRGGLILSYSKPDNCRRPTRQYGLANRTETEKNQYTGNMIEFHTGLLETLLLRTPQEWVSVCIRALCDGGSEETAAFRKHLASFDTSSSRVTNYVSNKDKYLKLFSLPKSLLLVSTS